MKNVELTVKTFAPNLHFTFNFSSKIISLYLRGYLKKCFHQIIYFYEYRVKSVSISNQHIFLFKRIKSIFILVKKF